MIKRIKSQKGFSLAETLLAILILLLVSVIVANGVPAARNAYEKVVIGANARVLLSMTISALRDELATATNVEVASDNVTITYYSADKGAASKISINADDKNIKLQEYNSANPISFSGNAIIYEVQDEVDETKTVNKVKERNLVSSQAATGDLYVTYDYVDAYTPGAESITIKGVKVCRASNDAALAEADLTVRFIIPAEAQAQEQEQGGEGLGT